MLEQRTTGKHFVDRRQGWTTLVALLSRRRARGVILLLLIRHYCRSGLRRVRLIRWRKYERPTDDDLPIPGALDLLYNCVPPSSVVASTGLTRSDGSDGSTYPILTYPIRQCLTVDPRPVGLGSLVTPGAVQNGRRHAAPVSAPRCNFPLPTRKIQIPTTYHLYYVSQRL